MNRIARVLLGALLLGGARQPAAAYDALYAFGDSLTDTGREPAEPLFHYQGRWSNGPLWVEYLSPRLGFPYNAANNYAHSGAQVDDMLRQIDDLVPPAHPDSALFVAWAGGNDFLQSYKQNNVDDAKWSRQIASSISNYSAVVFKLYDRGARTILVPNTVNLAHIPAIDYFPGFAQQYVRGKIQEFNAALAVALDQAAVIKPDLRLIRVDSFQRLEEILHDPSAFGFTVTDRDALSATTPFPLQFDGAGKDYVFWDPIHPTTKSHAQVAGWFYEALAVADAPALSVPTRTRGFSLTLATRLTGASFLLQRSTNLVTWEDQQTIAVTSAVQRVTLPVAGLTRGYFRLKWQP